MLCVWSGNLTLTNLLAFRALAVCIVSFLLFFLFFLRHLAIVMIPKFIPEIDDSGLRSLSFCVIMRSICMNEQLPGFTANDSRHPG